MCAVEDIGFVSCAPEFAWHFDAVVHGVFESGVCAGVVVCVFVDEEVLAAACACGWVEGGAHSADGEVAEKYEVDHGYGEFFCE